VTFESLADRGRLAVDDPNVAASQFNWLIMGEPLNRAILLGDEAIPKPAKLRRHAAEGVRMFLAAYGT
jgi:TetR/AcrR family transcriptional regulator, mexJK operon transcriptional repressor